MRLLLPRAAAVLAAVLLVPAALVLPAATTATATTAATTPAGGGSFAGSISGKRPAGAQSTVFATSLTDGAVVSATSVGKGGRFKVSLPAGAYAVTTTVIPPVGGGSLSRVSLPVSLKKGQKRTKIALKPKTVKAKAKKARLEAPSDAGIGDAAPATRSYTQESGATTPGTTAFTVEDFSGAAGGDWGFMNQGLTDLLITDLVGTTPCKTAVVANKRDRQLVLDELKLQSSKYFDPKSRSKRNFIISDLTVGGTMSVAPDGKSAAVTVTITDPKTGAVVDTLQTTLDRDTFFEGEEALAKQIAERVCRRPAAYELTLNANGTGDFGTHTAQGTAAGTLTALRSGGEAGQPPTAWSGVGAASWTGVTVAAKTNCSYSATDSPFSWKADLAVEGDTNVKLDWAPVGNTALATATATCPVKDRPPVIIPGQPGPALLGVAPLSTTLPLGGGTIPLAGFFGNGDGGWTTTGTLTVKPVWTKS